ncbi:MAG TPA: hypothetical protein VFQ38_20375 [Longimicrobiales bacterium]|nr:hypothetical protein [Longimicrobiales bacterium]
MTAPAPPPRQRYLAWVEERIEDYKDTISRDELLQIADDAVRELQEAPDGQYTLTELVLADAVDRVIFQRLKLPSFRQWLRACQNDTERRPPESTGGGDAGSMDERNSLE